MVWQNRVPGVIDALRGYQQLFVPALLYFFVTLFDIFAFSNQSTWTHLVLAFIQCCSLFFMLIPMVEKYLSTSRSLSSAYIIPWSGWDYFRAVIVFKPRHAFASQAQRP